MMFYDRIWWKYLLGIWMTLIILAAFLDPNPAKINMLGNTARIIFFHVPVAWLATLAFLISAIYSVLYLRKQEINCDIWASSSAQLGLMFAFLATVTGSIWAKEIWLSYWSWDPRQTTMLVLLMIYAAYFLLRSAVENEVQKAKLSAVYSIIAFVTVPFLVFYLPRKYGFLHPDAPATSGSKTDFVMDGRMRVVFLGSLVGFTVLFIWLLRIKVNSIKLKYLFQDKNEL
jgi:heme exporter protein C